MNNWKKRISYFVLLPLVTGSWLMVYFRYFSIHTEKSVIPEKINRLKVPDQKTVKPDLSLNYRDPFFPGENEIMLHNIKSSHIRSGDQSHQSMKLTSKLLNSKNLSRNSSKQIVKSYSNDKVLCKIYYYNPGRNYVAKKEEDGLKISIELKK